MILVFKTNPRPSAEIFDQELSYTFYPIDEKEIRFGFSKKE